MDFWISRWISGFRVGFLDFKLDFWISRWISGFQIGFLDFVWISRFLVGFLDFALDFGFLVGFLPTVYEISGKCWTPRPNTNSLISAVFSDKTKHLTSNYITFQCLRKLT